MGLAAKIVRWLLLNVRVSAPSAKSSMSLSCSSGHKVLESPFSHAQFYGGEHPASRASSLPSVGTGRKKGKPSKHKKATRSSLTSVSQSAPTKLKNKKKRNSRTFSASIPVKNHSHNKTSTSAVPSLAQVDSDISASSSKHPLRTNHVNYHSTHTRTEARTTVKAQTAGSPSTAEPKARYQHPDNSVVAGNGREGQGAPRNTTVTSLLTYSKMSTSALLLSMSDAVRGARGMAGTVRGGSCGGAGGGVVNRKCEPPRATLPPHMRVHRLVFQTHSKLRGQGVSGSKEAGPLDLEAIGKGLGRLQYRNIIVMSGAGISTSSGIPDFRYAKDTFL